MCFQMIATAIVVGITLHAGNHLACDFPRVIAASPEEYALVAGAFGPGKPTYAGLLSGAEGVTGVAMVVLMTVSFTLATHPFRKREPKGGGAAAVTSRLPAPLNRLTGFNAFWYSHHLLGIVYALLLVHGYFLFLVRRWYEKTVRARAHILLSFFSDIFFILCFFLFFSLLSVVLLARRD
jgi:respiratory burst oxidase